MIHNVDSILMNISRFLKWLDCVCHFYDQIAESVASLSGLFWYMSGPATLMGLTPPPDFCARPSPSLTLAGRIATGGPSVTYVALRLAKCPVGLLSCMAAFRLSGAPRLCSHLQVQQDSRMVWLLLDAEGLLGCVATSGYSRALGLHGCHCWA